MTTDELIVMYGLEGSEPATLTALQQALLPHVPDIIFFWWCVWAIMFGYFVFKYLLAPNLKK